MKNNLKRRHVFSFLPCSVSSRRPIVVGARLTWTSARAKEMEDMKAPVTADTAEV